MTEPEAVSGENWPKDEFSRGMRSALLSIAGMNYVCVRHGCRSGDAAVFEQEANELEQETERLREEMAAMYNHWMRAVNSEERLRAEVAEHIQLVGHAQTAYSALARDHEAQGRRVAALRAALEEYGDHSSVSCDLMIYYPGSGRDKCTCGFSALLAEPDHGDQ
jgi:hypothetical protein